MNKTENLCTEYTDISGKVKQVRHSMAITGESPKDYKNRTERIAFEIYRVFMKKDL